MRYTGRRGCAMALLLMASCATWRTRSALSPVDQADLETHAARNHAKRLHYGMQPDRHGTDDTPIGYVAVNLDGAGSVELTASTLIFNTPTSLTATAGSSGATLPDTPEGFLIATIGGFTALKIPFYQD